MARDLVSGADDARVAEIVAMIVRDPDGFAADRPQVIQRFCRSSYDLPQSDQRSRNQT